MQTLMITTLTGHEKETVKKYKRIFKKLNIEGKKAKQEYLGDGATAIYFDVPEVSDLIKVNDYVHQERLKKERKF